MEDSNIRVIIAGSRTVTSYLEVEAAFHLSPFSKDASMIVSGNARGVDRLGEQLAKDWALDLAIFPANWNRYKQAAGVIRNEIMANFADALVAVWDGESVGTSNMIKQMEALGKPVYVYKTTIS